jgi:hypothetical protein
MAEWKGKVVNYSLPLDTNGKKVTLIFGLTESGELIPVRVNADGVIETNIIVEAIEIGAVEFKDAESDTRGKIKSDGTDNAIVVVQNIQPLPTGAATEDTLAKVATEDTLAKVATEDTLAKVATEGTLADLLAQGITDMDYLACMQNKLYMGTSYLDYMNQELAYLLSVDFATETTLLQILDAIGGASENWLFRNEISQVLDDEWTEIEFGFDSKGFFLKNDEDLDTSVVTIEMSWDGINVHGIYNPGDYSSVEVKHSSVFLRASEELGAKYTLKVW